MCRATVGELYVPPIEVVTVQNTVQIENVSGEHCRQRGTQISCVACLLAFIILLIVIVRIIMEN